MNSLDIPFQTGISDRFRNMNDQKQIRCLEW